MDFEGKNAATFPRLFYVFFDANMTAKGGEKVIKETKYIDEKTGELIMGKKQRVGERFDPEKGYLFRNQKHGFKQFDDIAFPDSLTDSEIGKLTRLAKNIYRDSNLLAYRGNGGIKPHTPETISKIISLGQRQTQRFLSKMINLGVIARCRVEVGEKKEIHYYMNPLYFFSGNRVNLNLYLLFRNQLDPYIPGWAKNLFIEQTGQSNIN